MAIPQKGDRVQVFTEALDVVECDFIDNIAGNVAHVVAVYPEDVEAFVVANPTDEEGSYVPLEYLEPIRG